MRLSQDPTIDTVAKLGAVSVVMFAFVFVVMVPLYNVLCDVLGINGKTSSNAYTAVSAEVDESRAIKVQFIATNNDGMPWAFAPQVTEMVVHPGAANDTLFFAAFALKISRWAWIPTLATFFDYFKPCFLYFLSRGICCTKMHKLGGIAFSQLFKKVP